MFRRSNSVREELSRAAQSNARLLDQLTAGVAAFGSERAAALPQCGLSVALGAAGGLARLRARGKRYSRPPPVRAEASRASQLPRLALAPSCGLSRRTTRGNVAPARFPHAAHGGDPRRRCRRHDLHLRERHRADLPREPPESHISAAGRDARSPGRGCRGVWNGRQAASVQSRLRRDLEAVSGAAPERAAHQ